MKRILLIDDDRDDIELFSEALEEVFPTYQLHAFQDSVIALKKLDDLVDKKPDVIFLDMNIPVVSGWEILENLKKHGSLSTVPVYMFTTSSTSSERVKAIQLGAAGFLTKPSDYEVLKRLIRDTLQ